jgi:NAD(P)-dependent dehydrogenase (short-subunit alcohol dehydrogenase family)
VHRSRHRQHGADGGGDADQAQWNGPAEQGGGPEDRDQQWRSVDPVVPVERGTPGAPLLGDGEKPANGGGTLLNVLSSAAWVSVPTGYGASKAALWSATNALRGQLRGQGTQVIALLVGMIDTPMSKRWDVPKVSPQSVVAAAYDGVADGSIEVLADESTQYVKSRMSEKAEVFYPWIDELLEGFVP